MFSGLFEVAPKNGTTGASQGTISQVQKHKVIQPMVNKNGTSSSGVSRSPACFFVRKRYCEHDLDRIQSHWEWFPHEKTTWHPATINQEASYTLGVSSCRCTVCIRMHQLASILGVSWNAGENGHQTMQITIHNDKQLNLPVPYFQKLPKNIDHGEAWSVWSSSSGKACNGMAKTSYAMKHNPRSSTHLPSTGKSLAWFIWSRKIWITHFWLLYITGKMLGTMGIRFTLLSVKPIP